MSKKCPECSALSHQPHADMCSRSLGDTTELYYAHMEADRSNAETGYFNARKLLDCDNNRVLFRAGFERAYKLLWKPPTRSAGR